MDNATPTDEITYTYGDAFWADLLTEYDGKEIDRDEIGNPTSYDGWTYTWEHGRQLARAEKNGTTWDYTYNADGLRTSKSNGTETWNYVYNGSHLTQMTIGSYRYYFTYDANGTPLTVTVNNAIYYYVTNIQGDVVAILDDEGNVAATYTYNAWGVCNAAGDDPIEWYNPLRYRGYIYDLESGLYYLQSRYYDPEIGRFINADGLVATGQGLLGNNMFAYCHNNPVLYVDPSGYIIDLAAGATEEQIAEYERAIAYLKTSETGKKLISLLETSEIKFYIVLNDNNKMKYTSQNHTIYFDTNCGLILLDGTSTMSPALGLAHEMGHAAQHLDGTLHPGSNKDIVEALNLETYEIPIANELGEPVRDNYDASRGSIDMNNSIHFRTTKIYTRPWWHYLAPWNWFKSNRVVTDHNQ